MPGKDSTRSQPWTGKAELENHTAGCRLESRGEGVSLLLASGALVSALGLQAGAHFLKSSFVEALSWHFGIAALCAVASYILFRTFRAASQLKRREELLRERVGAESLFAQIAPIDPGERVRRADSTVGPILDVLLFVLTGALALHFWTERPTGPFHPAAGSALLAFVAFAAYVAGRYLSALAESGPWRPLGSSASWTTAGGLAAFLGVLAFGCAHAGWTRPIGILDSLPAVWFSLLALERALFLLGRMYGLRPAKLSPGRSRIVDAVASPGSAAESLNEALAYNFGIRISAGALRRFAAGTLLPFLAVSAAVALLLSCFVWIEPDQAGLRVRWGALVGKPLQPGLHLKAPWPLERVWVERVRQIRIFGLGAHAAASRVQKEKPLPVLWTEHHEKERLFLTPPWAQRGEGAGLIALSATLRYVVADLVQAFEKVLDPDKTAQTFFEHLVLKASLSFAPGEFFGPERRRIAAWILERFNEEAGPYGIRALGVSVEHAHVPVEAAEAFERVGEARFRSSGHVAAALIQKEAQVDSAGFEAETLKARSKAEAARIRAENEEKFLQVQSLAEMWREARPLLKQWLLLDAGKAAGGGRPKLVIPPGVTVYEVKQSAVVPETVPLLGQ